MKSCKIANHELYDIHSNGKVYSGISDHVLKPRTNPNGYLIVTIEGKQLSIHRLVAEHFIPNPYKYTQVNHINGNKSDNDYTNLEWCSPKQNIQHALKSGLRKGFVHVDVRRELLQRVLAGDYVANLATEIPNHPNTLNRMLREQAKKDNLFAEWQEESKRKRRITALKNLEKINASH